jgi:hypothetical protein
MANPPFIPSFTGEPYQDISILISYLYDLQDYMVSGEPDLGWSTVGISEAKTLSSGATLLQTQNVLGTLINVLREKNILSS